MYTVRFEDKKISAEDGADLKDCLEECGYFFPCKIGCRNDCVVNCSSLPITDGDKSFLSASEIARGDRILCDKTVHENLFIKNISVQKKDVPRHVLFSCDLVLSIDENTIDFALCEGEKNVEQKTVDHPFSALGSYAQRFSAIQEGEDRATLFRATINKESRFLLSLYGRTEAETAVICANGFDLRVLLGLSFEEEIDDFNDVLRGKKLGLPAKNVFILPPVDLFVSGKLFCRSVTKKDNVFLVDYGKNTTVLYIDKETDTYAYMWDTDRSFLSLLALRACLRVLRPEGYTPLVYLYGENAYFAEEILSKEGLTYVHAPDELDCVALACSPSFRSKLFKEKKRTSFHNLLKDEVFQDQLTLLQKDMETED